MLNTLTVKHTILRITYNQIEINFFSAFYAFVSPHLYRNFVSVVLFLDRSFTNLERQLNKK